MELNEFNVEIEADLDQLAWAVGGLPDGVVVKFILFLIDEGLEEWEPVREIYREIREMLISADEWEER